MLRVNPNPSMRGGCFSYEQYYRGTVEVVIYTVGGREVARLSRGSRDPGRYEDAEGVCWHAMDCGGRRVGSGAYAWRLLFEGRAIESEEGVVTILR
jgi:hypothetical protein